MANKVYYFNITYRCNNSCLFCAADLKANSTEQEMPIDELLAFLDNHNVDHKDRIIVNGGEPTVHQDFMKFISAINERGALIDLFTNGKKLANPQFAEELVKHSPMHIRIPLFGAMPETHDKLTGFQGNYKCAVKAIENILTLRHSNEVSLEIKMLLSKATIKENEGIFDTITSMFPDANYCFSLNPLLVSECVSERQDMFIDSYSSLMEQSINLINRVSKSTWGLKMDLIPFCAFPSEVQCLLPKAPKTEKMEYYSDPEQSYMMDHVHEDPTCGKCIYAKLCNHYPDSYLTYMGRKEIIPFFE